MRNCTLCSKSIPDKELFTHPTDGAHLHNSCAELYNPASPSSGPADSQQPAAAPLPGVVSCQQCGGEMEKTKKVERSMGLQLVGVLLFFVGLALLFVFPIGTLVGLIAMIVAARMGYDKKKVWKCANCGYFFERA